MNSAVRLARPSRIRTSPCSEILDGDEREATVGARSGVLRDRGSTSRTGVGLCAGRRMLRGIGFLGQQKLPDDALRDSRLFAKDIQREAIPGVCESAV